MKNLPHFIKGKHTRKHVQHLHRINYAIYQYADGYQVVFVIRERFTTVVSCTSVDAGEREAINIIRRRIKRRKRVISMYWPAFARCIVCRSLTRHWTRLCVNCRAGLSHVSGARSLTVKTNAQNSTIL